MRTQSIDTTPEVERLQIARIRSFSPARKFASVRSWTYTLTSANLRAMRSGTTEPNERDIAVRFVTREYGEALATDFEAAVEQRLVLFGRPPAPERHLRLALEDR